ncbi:hypothetical protein CSUI_004554, partial [Cystoisospora suis]
NLLVPEKQQTLTGNTLSRLPPESRHFLPHNRRAPLDSRCAVDRGSTTVEGRPVTSEWVFPSFINGCRTSERRVG